MNKLIILAAGLYCSLQPFSAAAQAVQNNGIERSVPQDRYLRLHYTNDFFTGTDYYYTQTILLEVMHPALGKSPLYRLLYHPSSWETRYGIAAEHDAYTPVYYERPGIQYGDQPFAGALFLRFSTIANDPQHRQRLSTALSTGMIGPAAGAGAMQIYIHEHTHNVLPQGWPNQIRNDVVLNYEMLYQRQLWELPGYLLVSGDATGKLGTLSTKAGIGLTVMAGRFQSPFASLQLKGHTLQLYAYDHPELSVTGYDATLQGGLFDRSSPYTIASGDISRVIFCNSWGLVMRIGKWYLEYFQSFSTRTFRTVADHRSGGIQIGFSF